MDGDLESFSSATYHVEGAIMPSLHIVYGEGGYDPSKPNDNIIEQREVEDQPAPASVDDIAAALSSLSPEALEAIRKGLGL